MRKNIWIVMLMLVTMGVGGWYFLAKLPKDAAYLLPPPAIIVDIVQPDPGANLTPGSTVPVSAVAHGDQPIKTMELWIDGALSDSRSFGEAQADWPHAAWTWQAQGIGVHGLMVRAVDVFGRSAQSMLVVVNVVPAAPQAISGIYTVDEANTLAGISAETGVPLDLLQGANPGLDPDDNLPGGQDVHVPLVFAGGDGDADEFIPPTGAPGPDFPDGGTPPIHPFLFWVDVNLDKLLPSSKAYPFPSPPDITAIVNGCDVDMSIQPTSGPQSEYSDEQGHLVYRADAGSPGLQKITTLGVGASGPGHAFSWTDTGAPYGLVTYVVSAFNVNGENQSQPVTVWITDPDCAGQQVLSFEHLELILTEYADEAYCYISAGGGKWTRVPEDPFTFVPPASSRTFDLTPFATKLQLPAGGETVILGECWGWAGGGLKFLGEGRIEFNSGRQEGPVQIVGDGFTLVGQPEMKPLGGGGGLGPIIVPPPYALMSTENVQVCAGHSGHAFGTVFCEGLLVPTPGEVFTPYVVLTWEWKPQPGWPGGTPVAGEVDGYKVRKVNKITSQLVQIVNKPNQKMIAFPKPWPTGSSDCYTVTAFINTDLYGVVESVQSNVFCLGGPTALETVVLKPSDMLSAADYVFLLECDDSDYGLVSENGAVGADEILAGVDHYTDPDDCYRQYEYMGGVKFDVSQAGVQNVYLATLRFDIGKSFYKPASYIATNEKPFCANNLGLATSDWTDLSSEQELFDGSAIPHSTYKTLSHIYWSWTQKINVTSAVNTWLKNPGQNHGFVLAPNYKYLDNNGLSSAADGHYECWNHLNDFELELQYIP